MNTSQKSLTQLAVFLSAVFLTASQAAATTISYNFDETGWTNTAGTTENFVGSFSGNPAATGALALTDLTGFTAILTETNAQNDTKTIASFGTSGLTDFLFDPAANNLTLSATGNPGATICLGDAIGQGLCGPVAPRPISRNGVPAPPLKGLFLSSVNGTLSASTTALPSLTLVQGLPSPVPAPDPAATPEPASLFLCGCALILVSVAPRFRRAMRTAAPF